MKGQNIGTGCGVADISGIKGKIEWNIRKHFLLVKDEETLSEALLLLLSSKNR